MKPDSKTHKVGAASARSCQLRGRGSGKKTFEFHLLLPFHPRCKRDINQHMVSPYEVVPGALTGRATSDYGPGKRQGKLEMRYSLREQTEIHGFLEMVVET